MLAAACPPSDRTSAWMFIVESDATGELTPKLSLDVISAIGEFNKRHCYSNKRETKQIIHLFSELGEQPVEKMSSFEATAWQQVAEDGSQAGGFPGCRATALMMSLGRS